MPRDSNLRRMAECFPAQEERLAKKNYKIKKKKRLESSLQIDLSPAFSLKVRLTLSLPGEHTRKTVLKIESLGSSLHETSRKLFVLCEPQFHYL